MALDIKKCFKAALLPAVVLIVAIVLLKLVAAFTYLVPIAVFLTGLLILIASLFTLGWAGYRAVKGHRMDIVGGAATGIIAGVIAMPLSEILRLALFDIGFMLAHVSFLAGALGGLYSGVGPVLIGIEIIIPGIVTGAIQGAICGAIGAYIASRKK